MFISKDIEIEDVEIGAGSFAKVYRGKRGEETLAVKVVKKEKLNAKILEALESEINIQSSIMHQHLVHLHGIIRDPESIYLVMEYCNLGDLSKYIKDNFPLQEHVVLNFISQLSRGIKTLL
jgi:serine/threonine-protein kinase ULK/ATG1